ncbi:MAG TPA: crosslink repair DNA glycosylase YcaQ family protein [Propionibacteriaceae bacterium]|nr:crosslink repair DNA glycosylase YcaQ family protein [Propionibacteriaceae bacterium]
MRQLSHDQLRRRTLRRQFPTIPGRGPEAVIELFRHLGPIQSQVPRAPFLTISSRLPGVSYDAVCSLFESHQLLKTSNIRGTVHTSLPEQFGWLDAVARRSRATQLRNVLKLHDVTPEQLAAEIEAFTSNDWTPRSEIVAHARAWLTERERGPALQRPNDLSDSLLWGHSGLVRRPRDTRWEKRTDIYHQRARSLLPELAEYEFEEALTNLVRIHLGSYGPALREDLAFFFSAGLGAVDKALRRLKDEVIHLRGPNDEDYLDLADPPQGDASDPGLRLLPEYDGLLVGYHGRHRTRFLTEQQLPKVWAKVNGLFSPVVLHGGRIVASWKTITKGRRTDIEATMLDPHPVLADDLFDDAIAATEQVLGLKITGLRVRPPLR